MEEATRQAVYLVWEDLHWIDPSSLEVLTLVLQQVPTSRALVVLTYRPDFTPPWRPRAHSTQLTLSRLERQHVKAMVNQVMAKAVLSDEVIRQIVRRTDGVPLFIEELTKSVIESVGTTGRSSLQALEIPSTLQDSLMARLDRLGAAKTIAQLGATLGREFSYELLQAVSPIDTTALQHSLQQLVDAELLYQRGRSPQATYLFKHALVQETAYQSLLKSKRQQYHQQIAQVFEALFPDTTAHADPWESDLGFSPRRSVSQTKSDSLAKMIFTAVGFGLAGAQSGQRWRESLQTRGTAVCRVDEYYRNQSPGDCPEPSWSPNRHAVTTPSHSAVGHTAYQRAACPLVGREVRGQGFQCGRAYPQVCVGRGSIACEAGSM